ncbi:MAG: hypothetical protein AABZ55_02345, partial [Bdellovibrionota bacterium]
AIYFDNIEIAHSGTLNINNAKNILTSRQIISGIRAGEGARGFSSRASLFAENRIKYFYFGGYIGDGNVSVRIDGGVIGANIEGVFSDGFNTV